MLISTHMQDLKDTTQDVHYENFRAQCISQISQHALALRERGKLKRESISSHNDTSITETDRLLLQKDEEVNIEQNTLQISNASHRIFSIKLMTDPWPVCNRLMLSPQLKFKYFRMV